MWAGKPANRLGSYSATRHSPVEPALAAWYPVGFERNLVHSRPCAAALSLGKLRPSRLDQGQAQMDPVTKLKLISDDQVVGVAEVAALLGTTEGQVYKLSSQQPQCLPPRLKVFGRRLAWRMGTCREWVRNLEQVTDLPDPERQTVRFGRPRKAL
jgi:predicted DNA-binding transcriptional regulator AlpA